MAEGNDSDYVQTETEENDSVYFTSYEDINVHTLMLKDQPRTLAYKNYMEQNPQLFKDKIVVDVGAGTGILSLCAAKAGAKKVYAIEASKISNVCQVIVSHNGYDDRIEVIHGRVEDVDLPAGVKADVIVSEWMGFYLLHESMLNSVITARDKWLAEDGIMVPSTASIYLCPVNMKEYVDENFDCWKNTYGFDFSPLAPIVRLSSLSEPTITTIDPKQCMAEPELVANFDMKFVQAVDLKYILGNFSFQMSKHGVLHGFACWFDTEFEGEKSVILHTGPSHPKTHWQQTIIFMPQPVLVSKQEEVTCRIELSQDGQNPRRYNITIEIDDEAEVDIEDDEEEGEEGYILVEDTENIDADELKELIMKNMDVTYTPK